MTVSVTVFKLGRRLTSLCVLPGRFGFLCFDLLLNLGLLIELVEVVHNDRDGKRDTEHSADGANLIDDDDDDDDDNDDDDDDDNDYDDNVDDDDDDDDDFAHRSDELAKPGDRIDVAVTHRGHRDDRPVEGLGVLMILMRMTIERILVNRMVNGEDDDDDDYDDEYREH